jgi:hypothetical protein
MTRFVSFKNLKFEVYMIIIYYEFKTELDVAILGEGVRLRDN